MTPKEKLAELLERLPEEIIREGEGFIPWHVGRRCVIQRGDG